MINGAIRRALDLAKRKQQTPQAAAPVAARPQQQPVIRQKDLPPDPTRSKSTQERKRFQDGGTAEDLNNGALGEAAEFAPAPERPTLEERFPQKEYKPFNVLPLEETNTGIHFSPDAGLAGPITRGLKIARKAAPTWMGGEGKFDPNNPEDFRSAQDLAGLAMAGGTAFNEAPPGAIGSFLSKRAKGVNLDTYREAQKAFRETNDLTPQTERSMAARYGWSPYGRDPKTGDIRLFTEISDAPAKFDLTAGTQKHIEREREKLSRKFDPTFPGTSEVMDRLIADSISRNGVKGPLKDFYNNPPLFSAYPHFENMQLNIVPKNKVSTSGNAIGAYKFKRDNSIEPYINIAKSTARNPQDAKLVVAHELQHGGQHYEDTLGPISNWKEHPDHPNIPNPAYQVYQEALVSDPTMQKLKLVTTSPDFVRAKQVWNDQFRKRQSEILRTVDGVVDIDANKSALIDKLHNEISAAFPAYAEAFKLTQELTAKGIPYAPPSKYINADTAYLLSQHEAQARATEYRHDWDDLKRQMIYPNDTLPWDNRSTGRLGFIPFSQLHNFAHGGTIDGHNPMSKKNLDQALDVALSATHPKRLHHTLARTGYAKGGAPEVPNVQGPAEFANETPYTHDKTLASPMDVAKVQPYKAAKIAPGPSQIKMPKKAMVHAPRADIGKLRMRKPKMAKMKGLKFAQGGHPEIEDALKLASRTMSDMAKGIGREDGVHGASMQQGSSSTIVKEKVPGKRGHVVYEHHEKTPVERQAFASGGTPSAQKLTNNFVQTAYEEMLGRAPSKAELNAWVDFLDKGGTDKGGLMSTLAQSVEGANWTNTKAVDQTFWNLAGRQATQADYNTYLPQLAAGTLDYTGLRNAISKDPDAQNYQNTQLLNDTAYALLGRPATQKEQNDYLPRLAEGSLDSNKLFDEMSKRPDSLAYQKDETAIAPKVNIAPPDSSSFGYDKFKSYLTDSLKAAGDDIYSKLPAIRQAIEMPLSAAEQAGLDLISKLESGGNYNMILGDNITKDPASGRIAKSVGYTGNLDQMPLNEVYKMQGDMLRSPANNKNSSAVGKLQFTRENLFGTEKAGFKDGQLYKFGITPDMWSKFTLTPALQDKLGAQMAVEKRGMDLTNPNTWGQNAKNEWASMWDTLRNREGIQAVKAAGEGPAPTVGGKIIPGTGTTPGGTTPGGTTPVTPIAPQDQSGAIDKIYNQSYGRNATDAEKAYANNRIKEGTLDLNMLAAYLPTTAEAKTYADASLDKIYNQSYGRKATDAEKTYLNDAINSGSLTRENLAAYLPTTAEGKKYTAEAPYREAYQQAYDKWANEYRAWSERTEVAKLQQFVATGGKDSSLPAWWPKAPIAPNQSAYTPPQQQFSYNQGTIADQLVQQGAGGNVGSSSAGSTGSAGSAINNPLYSGANPTPSPNMSAGTITPSQPINYNASLPVYQQPSSGSGSSSFPIGTGTGSTTPSYSVVMPSSSLPSSVTGNPMSGMPSYLSGLPVYTGPSQSASQYAASNGNPYSAGSSTYYGTGGSGSGGGGYGSWQAGSNPGLGVITISRNSGGRVGRNTGGAWTRKEGQNPEGGLNAKGRASAKAEGHNLKPPAPHPKTEKDAGRRKSFCSRMKGMKAKLTSSATANDPDSRINKSLRAWNCRADGGRLMHQDIMDALNLAQRRRGYYDGGSVADGVMSDDPTQQFMANLMRAGFTPEQINSIIGSQSPQPAQTSTGLGAPLPPRGEKPIGGQPIDPRYYPGGSPNFPQSFDEAPGNLGGQMGDTYGPGIVPFQGQPITDYAPPGGQIAPNYPPYDQRIYRPEGSPIAPPNYGGLGNPQMGGTGTKAGVGAMADGTIPQYNGPPTYNPGDDYGPQYYPQMGGMGTGLPFPYGTPGTNLGGNRFPGGYQSPYNPFSGGGAGHKGGGSGTKAGGFGG